MNDKFLNELSFTEFDQLVQSYINRTEPEALSIDIFQELVDESNHPAGKEMPNSRVWERKGRPNASTAQNPNRR